LKTNTLLFVGLLSLAPLTHADSLEQAWCETNTAEGLISLTANCLFGGPLAGSAENQRARSAWVKQATELAWARFKQRTGQDYLSLWNPAWQARCQQQVQRYCTR
jgi:hypothetical protein